MTDPSTIPRARWLEVARHLVIGDVPRAALARRFGVSRGVLTMWSKRHRALIEQVRAALHDDYAAPLGRCEGGQAGRLQSDYELTAEQPDAGHPEHIRVRAQLLRQVAEETGQLPPRTTIAVVPCTHILEGVDLDLLQ